MKNGAKNIFVISLGGSIVCPNGVDIGFLKKFKKLTDEQIKRGARFVLVIGGGRISREYQKAAGSISKVVDEDKDWIGIHATRLNAHLLRTIFRNICDPVIIDSKEKIKPLRYPITIGAGWRPGWSTDYVSVAIAKGLGVDQVIFAGKPDYVYNKDNQKFKDAKPFTILSWKEYEKLIPKKWSPGFHSPVDPVATRLAKSSGIAGIIVGGRDLKNFKDLLNEKKFKGTVIS